jgi:glycine/D-amino acid oxidase-like deaminating enzyme
LVICHTVAPTIPSSTEVLVIGAGIHGLSSAWHLAQQGSDVLVVDKSGVAAGASGIACGIVRNNYFQPAMSELMAACVEIWEAHAEALHYHPVGYVALGPASQADDLTAVAERHQRIGYPSELILGEAAVDAHMRDLFEDWRAPGLSVCLHERAGGFAFNREAIGGLAALARAAGAQLCTGVEVTGFVTDNAGAVTAVQTSAGTIACDQVVVAVGPWIPRLWAQLGLPDTLDVRQPDGAVVSDVAMWSAWYLQEGEVDVDPSRFRTTVGAASPVLHVDSEAPLHDDDGRLISDEPWGIYVKPDRASVQGGAAPIALGALPDPDPYPSGTVDASFADMWCASLSHCLGRFEGVRAHYREVRSGGMGAFTADSFPVFDLVLPNVFVAADSNHGFKMIAVGREIARVLGGEHSALLHPFRLDRFATGDLHPVSNSPYPWS